MLDGMILHSTCCMRHDWHEHPQMVDSSLGGFGIMEGQIPQNLVTQVGCYDERWRFKRIYKNEHSARERALHLLDPFSDPEAVKPLSLPLLCWEAVRDFPEVPPHMLQPGFWHEVLAGQWHFKEAIHILEARVVLLAVRRLARNVGLRGFRHLILCDNMSVVLAISKGRASDFGLLQICRKIAAYSVACDFKVKVRWVVSERNLADEPSRRFMTSELLEHEAQLSKLKLA